MKTNPITSDVFIFVQVCTEALFLGHRGQIETFGTECTQMRYFCSVFFMPWLNLASQDLMLFSA